MTFLIDENFPRSAADILTVAGHEVLFVDDVCEFGADDEEIFRAAQERHAVIVTSDRDFISSSSISFDSDFVLARPL